MNNTEIRNNIPLIKYLTRESDIPKTLGTLGTLGTLAHFRHFFIILLLTTPILSAQSPEGPTYHNYSVAKTKFSRKDYHEFSPVYYNGGLVFTTNKQKGMFSYSNPETGGLFNMYYTDTLGETGKTKVKYFSKHLNTKMNDGPATFNAGRDSIYFTRNRLVDAKIDELSSPWNKLGIYSAVKVDGKWVGIEEFRYNSEWYNVTTPCLSPDGKRLYFTSDKPQGYGGSDLYYSEKKNGFWEYPVNLGPVINTPGNESFPFFSPLGELYFSSDGHPGFGGRDIFVTRMKDTTWLQPVALGEPINSEKDDFGFISDTLMKEGYFSSDRDKSIDIYHFTTLFPEALFVNYQRENSFCFTFRDDGAIRVDTTNLQYIWHFGDGNTGRGAVVKHCYPGTGDFRVLLDVVDRGTGNLFFRKVEYMLNISEIKQAYIESPALAVIGEEVRFSGLKSNLPGYVMTDFAWDFSDSTRAHGESVSHRFEQEGDYEVTLFLNMRETETGKADKTAVTRNIRIVNNALEMEYLQAEAARKKMEYPDIRDTDITQLNTVYSAEKLSGEDGVFCIELATSKEKLKYGDPLFQRLPDKYILKERLDEQTKVYSYTVEQRPALMELYPAFRELRSLGFDKAQAKLYVLKDPAEKELLALIKRYGISSDDYFDRSERLTTDGYIMLDQILKLFLKYPQMGMEVGVHTDNTGSAFRSNSLSQQRAKTIEDYMITRGVQRSRILSRGYGQGKPIADNGSEEGRKKNRRVEFVIIQ